MATVALDTINDPPNLAPIDDQTAMVDQEMVVVVSAIDPDPGDELFFMLDEDNSPDGATIEQTPGETTATIRWTPTDADGPGPFSFRVIVLDNGDPVAVDSESFSVTLVPATPPVYDFSSANYSFTEGDAAIVTDVVSVLRSGNTAIASSVDVVFIDTTATADSDYSDGPITISFAPGETAQTVPIEVLGESIGEQEERFRLFFNNLRSGSVGTSHPTATFTIFDNDPIPGAAVYNFSSANYSSAEGDATNSPRVVTVVRSGNTSVATKVEVVLTPNDATPDVDYTGDTIGLLFLEDDTE